MIERLYEQLRALASKKIAAELPGHTLSATALVHEAWLKLGDASVEWNDRTHFLSAAATAMRRILVDRARAKLTDKRGGGAGRESLPDIAAAEPNLNVLAVDAALARLASTKPEHAKLVELRFFGGLTGEEAAAALDVSTATATRMWRYSRVWLEAELRDGDL